jgi:hypothetical protein
MVDTAHQPVTTRCGEQFPTDSRGHRELQKDDDRSLRGGAPGERGTAEQTITGHVHQGTAPPTPEISQLNDWKKKKEKRMSIKEEKKKEKERLKEIKKLHRKSADPAKSF